MTKSTGAGRGSNPASWKNTKRGADHRRWSEERMLSEHGYVKVRVGKEHPLADANGYCYEHLLVWVSAGREKPDADHLLHHKNEVKTDNRLANLELLTRTQHAAEHQGERMLTDEQVRAVRERFAAGEDGTALASEFGVPFQRIYRIVKGQTRLGAGGPIQTGSLRGRKKP
jgi:hypothetical protein